MKILKFKISWMTCVSCSWWVEGTLKSAKWVKKAEVVFATETAIVEYDENIITKDDIFKLVKDMSYIPIDLSLSEIEIKVIWMWSPHCAGIVKDALESLDWVEGAITNFSRGNAIVKYNTDKLKVLDLKKAIDDAWYEAVIIWEWENALELEEKAKQNDILVLKKRLILASVFSLPILYLAMIELISKSLIPWFISPDIYPFRFALTQILLSIPVIYAWYRFYTVWFKNLFAWRPNMDSLIALWTSSAYLYWAYAFYQIIIWNEIFVKHLYFETAWIIIALILLGKYLEAKARWKTWEAVKQLLELWAKTATILKDWKQVEVFINEIELWDIIVVKPWEKIAVDWEIIEWSSSVDESMITWESIPVEKNIWDKVIWATINKDGTFNFKATKIWKDTALAQIIEFIKNAQSSKAPIARLADIIAWYFTWAVIIIAILSFLIWYFIVGAWFVFSLQILITVLIIACPCALWLATPTSIMVWTWLWAKSGILIKNATALENTYKINAIVLDKTWTITKWKPELTKIISFSKKSEDELLILAWSIEQKSSHPLWEPIIKAIKNKKLDFKDVLDLQNISWKWLVWSIDNKKILLWNKTLLKNNDVSISSDQIKIVEDLEKLWNTVIFLSDLSKLLGIIAVSDLIRDSSKEAIEKMQKEGIDVYMITWDNKRTALAIWKQVWLKKENIFAEIIPEDKANIIKDIKDKWKKVAMVWDWINDAPALTLADTWIAIWAWTDVAIESADIVLMKSDLLDVVEAIKLSKATVNNIKQNLFFSFWYNSLGIPIAAWILFPFTWILLSPMIAAFAMSMSSVTVLLNALRLKQIN